MNKIFHGDKLIGIHITEIAPGSTAVTDSEQALQIVTLKHPAGASTKIHRHPTDTKTIKGTQKHLLVRHGKIRIDIYSPEEIKIKEIVVDKGESFVLFEGGWQIHFLEDSELIETKNGPFN